MGILFFFFFKQKTAYEIRPCDWSSDVCSSDLRPGRAAGRSGRLRRGGLGGSGGAEVAQRLARVLDPLLRIRSSGRVGEKGAQVLRRAVGVAALEEQERQAVVGAREVVVQLERPPVVADRFVVAVRFGERDRHVLKNAGVVGMVAQRQTVRREGRLVVRLALEGER